MKQKVKNIALQTLSCTITSTLCLGVWGLGFFLSFRGYMWVNRPLWTAVCIICAVIIVTLAVINIVGTKVLKKRLLAMKMREIYNLSETLKTDVEKDFKRAEKSVRLTLALAYTYLFFVILIMLLCCFGTGVLLKSLEGAITIIIIIVFVMWGITNVFFSPLSDPAPPAAYLLDKNHFPLIYSTAREAAEKSGCRLNIKIYNYSTNASITVYKRTAIICINYLYGALLTRDELFNVMLHEFAHIVNSDVHRSKTFSRAEQRFDSDNGNVITMFGKMLLLPLPAAAVVLKTECYNLFATRHHEIEADKALATLGDPQKSINALAKTKMVEFFESVPHRELSYDFFAPEQPTGDYAAQELALFLKHRELYGEEWQALIDKELPARIGSHPTCRNRMAALGCEKYDAYDTESDQAYIAEQREIIAAADRRMNEENANNYDDMRENSYVKRKKVIDEYDQAVKSGNEIADYKLYEYIQAFFGIDDDIALELADRAATLPDPTIANYYKAKILFNRNDDRCIDYLKAVAASTDNMELALSATDHIGVYALKTGNEELLKEYRSTSPEVVQASHDKGERSRFDKNSVVEKCDLGADVLQGVIEGINQNALKIVSTIYIGTYTDVDGGKHYPVAVCLKKRKDIKSHEALQDIYDFFFGYRGKYDFIVITWNTSLLRKIKKYGSCVYENE